MLQSMAQRLGLDDEEAAVHALRVCAGLFAVGSAAVILIENEIGLWAAGLFGVPLVGIGLWAGGRLAGMAGVLGWTAAALGGEASFGLAAAPTGLALVGTFLAANYRRCAKEEAQGRVVMRTVALALTAVWVACCSSWVALLWLADYAAVMNEGPRGQLLMSGETKNIELEPVPLPRARAEHTTRLVVREPPWEPEQLLEPHPELGVHRVWVEGKEGTLGAYLTDDPKDGRRHPAVLWACGGFGGVDPYLFVAGEPTNDQSVKQFVDAGLVVMTPSWRAENRNPGQFEMFYGEVDDYLAALDHLKKVRYVDPESIYLAGHSTGGTIVLLAATMRSDFRAAFSFGGRADITWLVEDGEGYGNTPFDLSDPREAELRSALRFTRFIERPTFYFEGTGAPDAEMMGKVAAEHGVPFVVTIIPQGNHFDILAPLKTLMAETILEDDRTEPFRFPVDEALRRTAHLRGAYE